MAQVRIILPDQSVKLFDHSPNALEVAQQLSSHLAQTAVGAVVDSRPEIVDVREPLVGHQVHLEIITAQDPRANQVIRHSAAHIMAQAVQTLWPEVKVTIGPVIEDGFYYDFDSLHRFTEDDFLAIESKMTEIVESNVPITRETWEASQAIQLFSDMGETYKVEIIADLKQPQVSIYRQGSWFDLCRGPHVPSTGFVKHFKLLSVAGAYWRGDETKTQLQRIYATAFHDKKNLKQHLSNLEEARRRDHRRLGKDLNLFYFHHWSPGSPFFTPKGTVIYNQLVNFLRELYLEFGYGEVISPQIYDSELYRQSGHYDHYVQNMYFTRIDERDFSVKPMNCPGHCLLFQSQGHSYRELPIRMADFGRLHRHERSGAMHGLARVRSFAQDDAHVFCTTDQIYAEICHFMEFLKRVYSTLGMSEYIVYLSTRPLNSSHRMGSDEIWDQSEAALKNALNAMNIPFQVNQGDGAFYGPKIDVMFVDALHRKWQLGTLQCDFNMPHAFQLKYIGQDNREHTPVMLHRAVIGSVERFIGVYLEHTAGRFPTWLSPVQVVILTLTDGQLENASNLKRRLHSEGIRVELDGRAEKLNYKIREAELQKIPYMCIIGPKEAEGGVISLRLGRGRQLNGIEIEKFVDAIKNEIRAKAFNSPFNLEV